MSLFMIIFSIIGYVVYALAFIVATMLGNKEKQIKALLGVVLLTLLILLQMQFNS